ncbi:hypothetical protein [Rhodococcus zopfii]|nr:hypothetical protein [Rhodococcus zopfii]
MQTVTLSEVDGSTMDVELVGGYLTVTVRTNDAEVRSAAWQWPSS